MVSGAAIDVGEESAKKYFPVYLYRYTIDVVVRAGIEAGVQRAIRVNPRDIAARDASHATEPASNDDPAICLHHRCEDMRSDDIGIEPYFQLSGESESRRQTDKKESCGQQRDTPSGFWKFCE